MFWRPWFSRMLEPQWALLPTLGVLGPQRREVERRPLLTLALRALSLCEGFGLRRITFHVGRVESDLGVLGVGLLFVLERNKRRNEVGVGEVVVAVRVEASKY